MKVLIADSFPADRQKELSQSGFEVSYQPKLTQEDLPGNIADHQALVVRSTKVQRDTFEAGSSLELVIRAGAGTNTIDKETATARKVPVCNCPGKNSVAVAELTMGLILALDRRIPDNVMDLRQGTWNKQEYSKAEGIKGKTLGLIGLGAIGRAVAKRAQAFDMTVIASDPFVSNEAGLEIGVEMMPQNDLLGRADIISLHAPAVPETKHMVNDQFLAAMKPGAMLLNCARADLVDHQALARAVKDRGLRYGTDVPPDEPKDKTGSYRHELYDLPGVYGTHHIGASTQQAQDAVAEEVLRILTTYREEKTALNQVNPF